MPQSFVPTMERSRGSANCAVQNYGGSRVANLNGARSADVDLCCPVADRRLWRMTHDHSPFWPFHTFHFFAIAQEPPGLSGRKVGGVYGLAACHLGTAHSTCQARVRPPGSPKLDKAGPFRKLPGFQIKLGEQEQTEQATVRSCRQAVSGLG